MNVLFLVVVCQAPVLPLRKYVGKMEQGWRRDAAGSPGARTGRSQISFDKTEVREFSFRPLKHLQKRLIWYAPTASRCSRH